MSSGLVYKRDASRWQVSLLFFFFLSFLDLNGNVLPRLPDNYTVESSIKASFKIKKKKKLHTKLLRDIILLCENREILFEGISRGNLLIFYGEDRHFFFFLSLFFFLLLFFALLSLTTIFLNG